MDASALSSLVFDCEVALSTDDAPPRSSRKILFDPLAVCQRIDVLSRASCPFARELHACVQGILADHNGDALDVRVLARQLAARGFKVAVRTALPGLGADCFKSLRHEFLVVRGTDEFSGIEFIVEPSLRQHFTIPHPSPEYAFALAATPDVFVGGSCRLVSIIQLLCALMADSFERQGLALPPWRREAAMLSKWMPQPNRTRDTHLPFFPRPSTRQQATEGVGRGSRPPRQAMHGYLIPRDADGHLGAHTAATVNVCRANSNSSNGSSAPGDGYSMGCSPSSVLPAQPTTLAASAGRSANAFVVAAEMATTSSGLHRQQQTSCFVGHAVHGFEPPVKCLGPFRMDAPVACLVDAPDTDLCESSDCPSSSSCLMRMPPTLEDSAYNGTNNPMSTSGTVCGNSTDSVVAGIGGGSSSAGGSSSSSRAGLLSLQFQQRSGASAMDVTVADTGSSSGAAAPECGFITMRPPSRPGEMAIRVVKRYQVGFPSFDEPKHQLQQQQQQQVSRKPQPDEQPKVGKADAMRPGLLPWLPFHRAA